MFKYGELQRLVLNYAKKHRFCGIVYGVQIKPVVGF